MNKDRLIELATELLKEEHLEDRSADLMYLKRQYKYLVNQDEESFYEKQLTEKFNSLYEELAKKEPKLSQSSADEKKEIIELAKQLLDRKDIAKASKDLDRYSELFRKAGRSSKELDDELFNEFKEVKNQFYAKKQAYFDNLNKENAEKRAKKEDIISRARKVLEVKNAKEANAMMDALFEEWRTVGYSGKEDDALWKEFSKVRKEFQNKKKERHQELLKVFEERAVKKEELIKTAKALLADSDFSSEEVKKVKALCNEFDRVGFTGKEKEDDLNARFDAVIKKYFEEKKFYTF